MKESIAIKELIYQKLQLLVAKRIATAKSAMEIATESRDNETKSTSGDKHETGRAMMHIEQEKNKIQLIKALGLKKELDHINYQKIFEQAKLGSIVTTNQGNYFLSIGLGKVRIQEDLYYAISMISPIGQLLLNKKVGEEMSFRGKTFQIKAIF